MKIVFYILIGYLIGALNPASLIARNKHINLRNNGTGNLGATNTMLVFGKKYGVAVMMIDIFKGFFVVKLGAFVVPTVQWIAIASGFAAIICFQRIYKHKSEIVYFFNKIQNANKTLTFVWYTIL